MSTTPQFFFFTGENTYALQHEVRRWKASFAAKHGHENMLTLIGAEQTPSTLMDAVATMPFIAEKRLVLCEGVPKIDKHELGRVLEELHPQVIFLVYAAKPDKRLSIVKELNEKAHEVKVFDPLPPAKLLAWVNEQAALKKITISPEVIRLLLSIVGDDQWIVSSELSKLAAGCDGEITADWVEQLCVPSGSQVVWRLTDLIGSRKAREALLFFANRIDRGEDPYGMWVILLNMIKNIGAIRMCLDAGVTDEKSIAKASGVHFFAVRGLLPLVRAMDRSQVKQLVTWAADNDMALKTGELKYTAEHPDELIALAERAIVACA